MTRENEMRYLEDTLTRYGLAIKTYNKAVAKVLVDAGYRQADDLEAEISYLKTQVDILKSERDNLIRTVEEGTDTVLDAKFDTAREILDLLIRYDDGDCNTEAIKLIAEAFGLWDYLRENVSYPKSEDDDE